MEADFHSRGAALERAFDRLLELHGERRELMALRQRTLRAVYQQANASAFRRRQRRTRMKVALLVVGIFGTAGSAAGAVLLQSSPKHPVLEWLPLALVIAAVLSAFVLWRANLGSLTKKVDENQGAVTKLIENNQKAVTRMIDENQRDTALDLAKKIDREVFDLRFTALEREMRLHLESIQRTLTEMRGDMERIRQQTTQRGA